MEHTITLKGQGAEPRLNLRAALLTRHDPRNHRNSRTVDPERLRRNSGGDGARVQHGGGARDERHRRECGWRRASRHGREALRRRPRPHRGPGGAALARRPDRAVHARRQPGEVAPRAHDLVLRDLPAAAAPARLRPLPGGVRLPVQLLLRSGRAAARASEARDVDAAFQRRGRGLPRACRRRHGRADARPAAGLPLRPDRARPAARGAAPGVARHRRAARPGAESPLSGLRSGMARAGHDAGAGALPPRPDGRGGDRPATSDDGRASPSTTRPRGTASSLRPSASPTGW